MAAKSAYQMTNRGRKGAPRWTVEKAESDGRLTYQYSNRSRTIAHGFLMMARDIERREKTAAALQAAEAALAEGDANCGGDADNVFHAPLLAVRAALKD